MRVSRVCGTCDPTASLSPARAQEPMGYAVGGHQGRKVGGFCRRSAPCWGPSLGSEAAPLPAAPTPCASLAGGGREEHASCSANCPSQQLPRGGGIRLATVITAHAATSPHRPDLSDPPRPPAEQCPARTASPRRGQSGGWGAGWGCGGVWGAGMGGVSSRCRDSRRAALSILRVFFVLFFAS